MLSKLTRSILIGSTLSIALAACATTAPEPPPAQTTTIAVKVESVPPAELTLCPEAPAGFPRTNATIPPEVRAGMMRLAKAYADVRDQLERLIEWNAPGSCGGELDPVEPVANARPGT